MGKSPHNFFQAIAAAPNEQELRLLFMKEAGEYFDAECWGLCLLNQESQAAEVDIQGGPNVDAFVQRYEKIGRSTDHVLRYVLEHHAPAHDGVVVAGNVWKKSELYQKSY